MEKAERLATQLIDDLSLHYEISIPNLALWLAFYVTQELEQLPEEGKLYWGPVDLAIRMG